MPQMFEYGFQHHESAAGFVAFAKHYMPFLHNLNPGCQTAAPEGEIADRATVVGAFDLIHALELCARMPTDPPRLAMETSLQVKITYSATLQVLGRGSWE